MKIWITKYWATRGIYELEVEPCQSEGMYKARINDWNYYYHKGDYELTEDAAKTKVKDKAEKKIISLQKQIIKLSKLTK